MVNLKTVALVTTTFTLGLALGQNPPQPADNSELAAIYKADQEVRQGPITELDWPKIATLDKKHQARVAEMLQSGDVKTGADYFHAAMVFQHASGKQGYKLAHELAVIAATKGESRGKWLSAASWDRFLGSISEPQRFGTQYKQNKEGKFELAPVDPEVTDAMRRELNCPTLQQAKDRAKDF